MMFFNKKSNLVFFSAALLLCASCSNDDVLNDNQGNEQEVQPIEVKDFRCITLNRYGIYGEEQSLSYISKSGEAFSDYFKDINGYQIHNNPFRAAHINDDLFIVYGGGSTNGIEIVDPVSFESKRNINFGSALLPYDVAAIDEDRLLVVGGEKDKDNFVVGSLSAETFTQSSFILDFSATTIKTVGSKVFIGGFRDWNPYSAKYLDGKLIVLDKNNLTKSGIRVIRELTNLPSWSNDIVLDKNNNLWMISVESGINKLLCVDTDTEKVIHEINLPVSYFSTLRTAAYDIDNDGKYLYLRSHKAFFIIDVDSPSIPDEAHGEIRELVGELYDIKVSADGTILVIDQGQGNFVTSSIVEFKQDGTGNKWQELSRQTIGYQATKIYVPNYVKRY